MSESTAASSPDANLSIMADPRLTVERLLDTEDEARVRAVMRSLSPEQAAHLLQYAPTSRDKARLLGVMERRHRAETLDHVAPAFFATLVENKETGTDYLLGEVSYDRFRELLALCGPEQRFYWVSRAAAHNDTAAQLLTILLPPRDLAEMLMTVPEFRRQFGALRRYEPGQFEGVPCRDPRLRAVLQFMSDFDTELYKEVFQAAGNLMDWEHVNREATEAFVEPSPLSDFEKYEAAEPDAPRAAPAPAEPESDVDGAEHADRDQPGLELALTQADASALATTALDAERLQEIQSDLEAMIQREIVDAGGSFAPEAIEQASGRVHCYLHYGLLRLGGGSKSQMARLLAERSLTSILNAGAESIEAIRQRALRIAYLRDWFDRAQTEILEGLIHPRVGVLPGSRTEYILWLPTRAQKKEELATLRIDRARDTIEELSGWAHLAQHMPEQMVRRVLAASPAGAQAYLGALAVAIAMYRRWEPALIDIQDVYDFRDRMVDPATGAATSAAREGLDAAAARWTSAQGMTEEESRRAGRALIAAADRLAEWLVRYPRPKPAQCRNHVMLGL